MFVNHLLIECVMNFAWRTNLLCCVIVQHLAYHYCCTVCCPKFCRAFQCDHAFLWWLRLEELTVVKFLNCLSGVQYIIVLFLFSVIIEVLAVHFLDVMHFCRERPWSIWYSAWRMACCNTHEWHAIILAQAVTCVHPLKAVLPRTWKCSCMYDISVAFRNSLLIIYFVFALSMNSRPNSSFVFGQIVCPDWLWIAESYASSLLHSKHYKWCVESIEVIKIWLTPTLTNCLIPVFKFFINTTINVQHNDYS